MKIGIEIETVYNRSKVGTINIGGYGNGIRFSFERNERESSSAIGSFFNGGTSERDQLLAKPKWVAGHDSSINYNITITTPDMSDWTPCTVELVSDVANGKEKFIKMLEEIKSLMTCNCSGAELKDIMHFNTSCGCHLHFSFKDFDVNKICGYRPLTDVRNEFFDGLNKLDIRSELKKSIRSQYFRAHAKKLTMKKWKNNVQGGGGERGNEFNFRSFTSKMGFEWRSFNLLDVETWDEFFKVLLLGYDSANSLRDRVKKFSDTENYDVSNQAKDKIKSHSKSINESTDIKPYKENLNIDIFITGIGQVHSGAYGKLTALSRWYEDNKFRRELLAHESESSIGSLRGIAIDGFVGEVLREDGDRNALVAVNLSENPVFVDDDDEEEDD